MIIAVNFFQFNKKPEKYQGFNRILTRNLRDTGAMLDQLSCEATHWERGQFVESNDIYEFHIYFTSFHCTGRYELNKLTSLPMRGFTALLVEHHTAGIAQVTGFFFSSGFFHPIA